MSVIHIGAGGRPRKSDAEKKLSGTFRPSRANKDALGLAASPLPAPPSHLSAVERQTWRRLAKAINPLKIATAADVESFALMVQAVAVAHLAASELFRGGVTIVETSVTGEPKSKTNPAFYVFVQAQKLVMLHFSRWGMSPVDRGKVSALASTNAVTADPLDEFST